MRTDNPFDKKIELLNKLNEGPPENLVKAAIFVTDTLELCLASAQAVFEDVITIPSDHSKLALKIYDRVIERMEIEEHEKTRHTQKMECIKQSLTQHILNPAHQCNMCNFDNCDCPMCIQHKKGK